MSDARRVLEELADLGPYVRYVAALIDGDLVSRERESVPATEASGRQSDPLDDLLANQGALELVHPRGRLDDGGARFVAIRYGEFWQLAMACRGGHISIGIDPGGDPMDIAAEVSDALLSLGR